MSSQATATFKCRKCGTKIEWDENLDDDDTVVCPGCGEPVGTLADLKAAARKAIAEKVTKVVKDAFRKR